ncbi:MAG: hypothetical protein NZ823_01640 [Blastocatellia bacterium]|nr:hypothetical protein [Blastocatellia bacterium]
MFARTSSRSGLSLTGRGFLISAASKFLIGAECPSYGCVSLVAYRAVSVVIADRSLLVWLLRWRAIFLFIALCGYNAGGAWDYSSRGETIIITLRHRST